jgi:hypothetical protein
MTQKEIQEAINELIDKLKTEKPSHELSIVVTKLQEAKLWATQIEGLGD